MTEDELQRVLQKFADEHGTNISLKCYGGDLTLEIEVKPMDFRPEIHSHHGDVAR